jgi:hypothetical protein
MVISRISPQIKHKEIKKKCLEIFIYLFPQESIMKSINITIMSLQYMSCHHNKNHSHSQAVVSSE